MIFSSQQEKFRADTELSTSFADLVVHLNTETRKTKSTAALPSQVVNKVFLIFVYFNYSKVC